MVNINKIGKAQANFLYRAYNNKQLAQSYLFVDSDEEEALNTAYWLACLFNCTGQNKPDGKCQNCRQIISGNHPDVLLVEPEGKQTLGIDQIRPLKEELAKSPVESTRRFFFINEAERLTLPAANALLNLLEEPIAPVVSILITNNSDQILPTVRSRTQIVNFDDGKKIEGKTAILIKNGFSQDEITELGDTNNLDQMIKYFYQEMLEKNSLALVSAHRLADEARGVTQQRYVLINLKLMAQKDVNDELKRQAGARMLKCLIEVDKMRYSNVNFRNLLDYLALQWKR
ncbi:DNA polymerase III subunit delta [Lactobacillus acetotolerans]|jgi:DNA polymerase-3 subunit delta'|uniref:DNA polymerase III subunit delta n=1 Tax=Lactobacillus acetotolerans TaxID=1600 RepID=A0A356VPF4_9LACO|nr:DNA polymerase III subunit delta [Lactobacillus acetotolerans]KRN42127.1 DNA polymerase III, delta subunit [Lactobacillus acetotolerans DSM 20749 = JCM 3825]MBN7276032.1 DNA polymerase III subunit delta [Lactobacillus acetotolerans]QFG50924.1 DNA polymerase III subunit delta [Lactobacillus acetotolerans]QGV04971.1 DNA polymerase III subunit delta [Lactobacillus acetotolerans]QJD72473.1 DNA polymerase III subunit delta [Lactobacillus acetotolerans]